MTEPAPQQTATPAPVQDGEELQRRLMAGEPLHHGLAPNESKPSWWLCPSMTKVLVGAVYAWRKEVPSAQ